MTQTVLYWLCGAGYAETMAVSLFHLRKHWQGDVAIAYATDCPDAAINKQATERLASMFDARMIPVELPRIRRHRHYVAKASLWRKVDGQVVFLDADTVPVAPIDALFTDALTVVQFSDWRTDGGRIMKGRMQCICQHLRVEYPSKLDGWPAINTGVFAWGPAAREFGELSVLDTWESITQQGHAAPFTDELAMQYILPYAFQGPMQGAKIEHDCWNHSSQHGKTKPVKIWHFHGRRHVRKPEGRAIWQPLAAEALQSAPGLSEWWGSYDPAVQYVREGMAA